MLWVHKRTVLIRRFFKWRFAGWPMMAPLWMICECSEVRTLSIAKKPYIFVIFGGWGPDPLSFPLDQRMILKWFLLFTSQSPILQPCRDVFLVWTCTKQRIKWLAQWYNIVSPVSFKPANQLYHEWSIHFIFTLVGELKVRSMTNNKPFFFFLPSLHSLPK